MAENALPQNVGRLLDLHFYSVSQLETLLFLRRHRERSWNAHEVANEMHSNDAAAFETLRRLAHDGLVSREQRDGVDYFIYREHDSAREADVEALAKAYMETRMRVIDRIYQKPSKNSLNDITDSFLLRREDKL